MDNLIEGALFSLLEYIEKEDFQGYDPHDALNSSVLKKLSGKSKWLRIAFTQLFRRMPLNLRPFLGVRTGYNPKGIGLILSSYANLYKVYERDYYLKQIRYFADWLIENPTEGYSGHCWGYNFDWQSREAFRPRNIPTIVATVFVANALLDAYEVSGEEKYFRIARSSCNFILKDLNRTYENGTFCWSYSPLDQSRVYNTTMLGSKLLARIYTFTGEVEILEEASRSIEYAVHHQNDDGSWGYGILPYQQWIDSFHTGYNLECLHDFMKFSGKNEYQGCFERGLQFYRENFFLSDFTPKYYHNAVYPIDIHCPSQAIVCFAKLGDADFARKIALWTIENMQSPTGYFYYQKRKYYTSKIPYMRWGQAWMLYALSRLTTAVGETLNQ